MGQQVAEAAAAAAVGTDMLANHVSQFRPYPRRITWVALVGGAAVGTGKVDIYVGDVRVAKDLTVTTAAQGLNAQVDILPTDIIVPAGAMLQVIITEAAATNPTLFFWNEVP